MRRAVVVLVVLLAGTAHADKADALFKKGKKLLAEKRYPEACAAFEDSDRTDPGIGAKLNVAKCYQEWGKLATAYRWYADAEAMARTAKDDRAGKIHELIEELDATVPRLTIKAPADADLAGVTIKLDGAAFAIAELGAEHRVDPGPHLIEYSVNATALSKTVPVERGGSSEITLELPSKVAGKSRGGARTASGTSAPVVGRTQRIVGAALVGAGGIAVGIAGVMTLKARGDYKDALDDHCRGATDMCDAAGLSATHDARHRANIATAITLTGVAAVAGGVALYLLAPTAGRGEHALYLAPEVSADRGTLVLGGRF